MSPVEGDRSERTLGLGCGFKLQGHARTRRPGSGGRAAWQATGLLGLPLRAFAARPDSIGAARPLWSAGVSPPCHILSSSVGLPAEPAEVRLEPGSGSHQSSRFFLLRPPAISHWHSTLVRPGALLLLTSPGPRPCHTVTNVPRAPSHATRFHLTGKRLVPSLGLLGHGSPGTFPHRSPRGSHEFADGCHSPCLASGVPAFSLALLQFASWIKPGEFRRWRI